MKRFIFSALLFMAAGLQTAWAQKVLIYKTDRTTIELKTSEVDSMVFVSPEPIPSYLTCPDDNHPHAIDLGLPSGTKWACCNVGSNKPKEGGSFYAWGETSTKNTYDLETYAYWKHKGNHESEHIGYDIACTPYDVAFVLMGTPWRMPSHEQQMELVNNCSQQWANSGILFTGRNGGQIFLPAAGWRIGDKFHDGGICSYFWSSTLGQNGDEYSGAHALYISSGGIYDCISSRGSGHSVRAVCP